MQTHSSPKAPHALPEFSKMPSRNFVVFASAICAGFTFLMMIVSIPGILAFNDNVFEAQAINAGFQILFCIFGGVICYFIYLSEREKQKTLVQINQDQNLKEKQSYAAALKAAFPSVRPIQDEQKLFDDYKTSQAHTVDTIKAIFWIWVGWTIYYIVFLAKNWYWYKSKDNVTDWHNGLETLEILANNVVGVLAFILFLKFYSRERYKKPFIIISVLSVVLISILHVSLLYAPGNNPYKVNWVFKVMGSLLNGIGLSLLFIQLCSRLINTSIWFTLVFSAYAVAQPMILINSTEAFVLRMPKQEKTRQSTQIVDGLLSQINQLNQQLDNYRRYLEEELTPLNLNFQFPADLKNFVKKQDSEIQNHLNYAGPLSNDNIFFLNKFVFHDRLIQNGGNLDLNTKQMVLDSLSQIKAQLETPKITLRIPRDTMIQGLIDANLDTEYLKTIIFATDMSPANQKALIEAIQKPDHDLLIQDEVLAISIMRRWYLAFGKCCFLLFVIWLFEKRRTILYFLTALEDQRNQQDQDFNQNNQYLPAS